MSLSNMMALYMAVGGTHYYGNRMFQTHQDRMALANQAAKAVGFGATIPLAPPLGSVEAIQGMDRALELQGIQAQVMYQANQAMLEAAQNRLKKEFEAQRQRIANGGMF